MKQETLSRDLRRAILLSYRHGQCVGCHHGVAEEVDHIKPRRAKGPNVLENFAPLCERCNKIKSCMWPGIKYRPFKGYDNPAEARAILEREIAWSAGIYGMDHLWATVGPDFPDPYVLERGGWQAYPSWWARAARVVAELTAKFARRPGRPP